MGVILSFRRRSRVRFPALAVLGALALVSGTGCAPAQPSSADGVLRVSAAFYPLQFVVERIGDEHVRVTNLTAAGAEPHDVELSARDLVAMRRSDLVVYLAQLSPAIDDAVKVAAASHALDVAEVAGLHAEDHADEDGHEEEPHAADDGHDHGADMHFWLDPLRLVDVVGNVAGRLALIDPAHRAVYLRNAEALVGDLQALDRELAEGLTRCESRDLVTSHSAFGFLAERYGLQQWGISGLSPEAEPTASALAEIADLVRQRKIRSVYTETLVSGAVARTVADATSVMVGVLDPLEGLAEGATGDYLSIMRTNLATLRRGLGCT